MHFRSMETGVRGKCDPLRDVVLSSLPHDSYADSRTNDSIPGLYAKNYMQLEQIKLHPDGKFSTPCKNSTHIFCRADINGLLLKP